MIDKNDATLLGPPASRGPAPIETNDTQTPRTIQTGTLEPPSAPDLITPTPSEVSRDAYQFFSASNSGSTGNTGSSSNFRRENGQFAPGHPFRFQPGQSGNPKGRPKRPKPTPLSEALHEQLAKPVPKAPHINFSELIARLILSAALSGDMRAIREMLNRTVGRPRLAPKNPHRIAELEQWPQFREAILKAVEHHRGAKASIRKAISAIESVDLED